MLFHAAVFHVIIIIQPNACATFNYLISEGRVTGAALIPPESL